MARMHARRRGKSGSVAPYRTEAPEWCGISGEEAVKVVIDLRKTGKSSSEIGFILRDKYGIPDIKLVAGKKIGEILEENGLGTDIPEDLRNLIVKALAMRKHLEENKKDLHNKRQLQLTESKVRRLVKYYRSSGKLAADWTYKPETAEILLSR
ncbi:30S ribosomal protein S15 [Methanofollis aquaemaris]|uniref:Small ribosomal subunit protein uS15 n=1 Tax=Methanofollis aquaemaris TaxID=126734 RepID=A0A8A3S487_9EURY|nr:30S ribosomal protein S15 [Methanofollis aquaemaris]QSZ66958.1 30S ribosomal protein S15 [Methanofollis aquaemaris]